MKLPATTIAALLRPGQSAGIETQEAYARNLFVGSLLDEDSTRQWTLSLAAELERHTGERRNVCDANQQAGAKTPAIFMAALMPPAEGLCRLARSTDAIILLLPPEEEAYYRCRLFEHALDREIIPVIWNAGPKASPRPSWLHSHQPILASDDFNSSVRAVARRLLKLRVGLALSAGSARGLAHVGAIQVLEEQGIEIDAVAGASMGAYVGACWCSGHDGQALEVLASTIKTRKHILQLTDPVFPPRRGFLRGIKIRERLAHSLNKATFEELVRPLYVVLTDLETLGSTIISKGNVASAVHASFAIPGICEPVMLNGRSYTDGGTSDPLPVDVLRNLGMDRIIAVNVLPSLAELEALAMSQGRRRAPRWTDALKATGQFFNQQLNYFAKGNMLDTVMRGLQAAEVRLAEASGRRADVYIHACSTATQWWAFDAHATAIARGRAAATTQIPALKTLQPKPV